MNWREYQGRQRVSEIGDRFVSYIDEGSGDPLVLLHGIPTRGYLWEGLIPALAQTHRVLVPDLLGFGYSDRSDRFDRSIARQAEMIDAWLGKATCRASKPCGTVASRKSFSRSSGVFFVLATCSFYMRHGLYAPWLKSNLSIKPEVIEQAAGENNLAHENTSFSRIFY